MDDRVTHTCQPTGGRVKRCLRKGPQMRLSPNQVPAKTEPVSQHYAYVLAQAVPIAPERFGLDDTEQLVQQLMIQTRKEADMLNSAQELAASVYNLTDGHKGLTDVCLYQLDRMIGACQPITANTWAEVEPNLPFWLGTGGIPNYNKLVQDLVEVQEDPGVQRIMQGMLHNEDVLCREQLSCISKMLWRMWASRLQCDTTLQITARASVMSYKPAW